MSKGTWKKPTKKNPQGVTAVKSEGETKTPEVKTPVNLEINPIEPQKPSIKIEVEGEEIDLTDDELKELIALLSMESSNLLLRILKRQLMEEKEGSTFAKLSLPYFKAKLKEKVNLGLTGPLLYWALVMVSKPLTPEGQALKDTKDKDALQKKQLAEQKLAEAKIQQERKIGNGTSESVN